MYGKSERGEVRAGRTFCIEYCSSVVEVEQSCKSELARYSTYSTCIYVLSVPSVPVLVCTSTQPCTVSEFYYMYCTGTYLYIQYLRTGTVQVLYRYSLPVQVLSDENREKFREIAK